MKPGWERLHDCFFSTFTLPTVEQQICWPSLSPAEVINVSLLQTKVTSGGRGADQSTRAKRVIYGYSYCWEKKLFIFCRASLSLWGFTWRIKRNNTDASRNELSRTVEQHCCGITVIIFIVLRCLSPYKYFYIYCQYIMALVMGMANRWNYSSAVLMKIYLLVFCGTCRVAF